MLSIFKIALHNLTPEEKVRQEYICRLVNNYGYSLEQMVQEETVEECY